MGWNNWLYAERLGQKEQAPKPMTNADRIRAMSDEELVEHFWEFFPDEKFCTGICNDKQDCNLCRLAWLQQPAGDAEQERPKATGSPEDGFGAHIARRFGSEV